MKELDQAIATVNDFDLAVGHVAGIREGMRMAALFPGSDYFQRPVWAADSVSNGLSHLIAWAKLVKFAADKLTNLTRGAITLARTAIPQDFDAFCEWSRDPSVIANFLEPLDRIGRAVSAVAEKLGRSTRGAWDDAMLLLQVTDIARRQSIPSTVVPICIARADQITIGPEAQMKIDGLTRPIRFLALLLCTVGVGGCFRATTNAAIASEAERAWHAWKSITRRLHGKNHRPRAKEVDSTRRTLQEFVGPLLDAAGADLRVESGDDGVVEWRSPLHATLVVGDGTPEPLHNWVDGVRALWPGRAQESAGFDQDSLGG